MKSWLEKNSIEMYSTHNEGKSVITERFIGTLKNKTKWQKHMNWISKNVYIDKLDDIVNKHKKTYHRTIKIKLADVKRSTYNYFNQGNIKEGPKPKVSDNVRTSKYENVFAKGYVPNWTEEIFVIKNVKNTVSWTCIFSDLNGVEIVGAFYEKELQIKESVELKK